MRIRGYDEETEELSDDLANISGVIADLTKSTQHPMGVSLFKDEAKTEYKSTYQILKDISEVYDELTDKQQAQLLEKLAGKRGGQVLAGILGKENFKEVDRALQEIEQSVGSADAEMGIVEESIAFKMNALKETWVGVLQEIANNKDIGKVVDSLIEISEAVGSLIEELGLLGTVGLGAGIYGLIKSIKPIKSFLSEISAMGPAITQSLNALSQIQGVATGRTISLGSTLSPAVVEQYRAAIEGLTESQARLVLSNHTLGDSQAMLNERQIEQILAETKLAESHEEVSLSTAKEIIAENTLSEAKQQELLSSLEAALGEESLTTERLKEIAAGEGEAAVAAQLILEKVGETGANTKLIATEKILNQLIKERIKLKLLELAKNPLTWIAVALGSVVLAIHKTVQANNELRESAKKIGEEFSSSKKEIESYKSEIEKLHDKINDSSTSYEEAKQSRQRLMDIQDELIDKYGSESRAVGAITDAVNGSVEAFDRLAQIQWRESLNEFNNQNLKGWDSMNRMVHGVSDNVGVMLADMERAKRSLFVGSYDYAEELAKLYDGKVLYTGNGASVELSGDLEDIYNKIIAIQELTESKGLNLNFNKDAKAVKELLEQYSQFYDQYVLNERILGGEYEDEWIEWQQAYRKYADAVTDGNEDLASQYKDDMLSAYHDLRSELENSGLEEPVRNSILNAFRDAYPNIKSELQRWDIEEALMNKDGTGVVQLISDEEYQKAKDRIQQLETQSANTVGRTDPAYEKRKQAELKSLKEIVEEYEKVASYSTKLSGRGNQLASYAKEFSDSAELLNMRHKDLYDNASEEMQNAYDYLQVEADLFGVSIEELLQMLYEAEGLDFQFMHKGEARRASDAYFSATGNYTREQDVGRGKVNNALSMLSNEDYETTLLFTEKEWKKVNDELLTIAGTTDLNKVSAEQYKRAVESVTKAWRDAEAAAKEAAPDESDIVTSVEGITKRLKDQFDELGKAYQGIFYGSDSGGFTLEKFDVDEAQALVNAFKKIGEEIEGSDVDGVKFENADKALNKFIGTLTSAETKSKSLPEQEKIVQQAFDDLATEYFYNAEGLKDVNEETVDAIEQMFSQLGIVNAHEVVHSAIDAQIEIQNLQEQREAIKEKIRQTGEGAISDGLKEAAQNANTDEMKQSLEKAVENAGSFEPDFGDLKSKISDAFDDFEEGMNFRESADTLESARSEVAKTKEMIEALGTASENAESNSKVEDIAAKIKSTAESANIDLATEAEQLGITTQQLADYLFMEQMADSASIDNSQECAALLALARDAGVTAEAYEMLLRLLEIYTGLESGVYGQGTEDRAKALAEAADLKNKIADLVANGASQEPVEVSFKPDKDSARSAGGSAGKEAGDAYVDAFNKELEELDRLKSEGKITEKQYLDYLRALYNKYFKDIDKYAKEYAENQKKYLDGRRIMPSFAVMR